jgi:hypothetical protein
MRAKVTIFKRNPSTVIIIAADTVVSDAFLRIHAILGPRKLRNCGFNDDGFRKFYMFLVTRIHLGPP